MAVSTSRSTSPGWVVRRGQPGTRTVPPVTAAAARKGAAFDRSGSTSRSSGRTGPGSTRQVLAVPSSTTTPTDRSSATVMSRCGWLGTGAPSWCTVTPAS
ncbi:hypothetical protein GCM10025868_37910 [Angustibacter aerolatus]|uniref:Uncharacterized protein n=1 Tax=Angustibacter aerolatus TaxID=1162965 RepID=A0ABQ6JJW0_9ACTN|nr:hypothetical protein GCM10025868_37910 [Angustibacter aerolatus]